MTKPNTKAKAEKGIGHDVDHFHQHRIPEMKLRSGSVVGKIPKMLSDGRSIIFIRPGKESQQIVERYEKILRLS